MFKILFAAALICFAGTGVYSEYPQFDQTLATKLDADDIA